MIGRAPICSERACRRGTLGRVTKVFITRTGERYHVDQDCPSFADAERQNGRPIQRWQQDLRGLSQDPCQVCWPTSRGYDAWRQFELSVERQGDSPYEALFVDKVLRNVPGLRPADVGIQQRVTGRSGATYYVDFVLSPEDGHRIAVEIDGRDKAPGTKTVDEVQSDVDRKRADLAEAGWRVLNFRNARVATNSDQCVSELRAALRDAVAPRAATPPLVQAAVPNSDPPRAERSARPKWVLVAVLAGAGIVAALAVAWTQGRGDEVVTPSGGDCPASAPIKGNVSRDGVKIYHAPGWEFYTRTGAEECFASEDAARDAGYRASEVQ